MEREVISQNGKSAISMVRDLLELAVGMVRAEQADMVREQAEAAVERRLVSLLLGEAGATLLAQLL